MECHLIRICLFSPILSAYNIFFQRERVKVLEDGEGNNQNISFEELGRTIGMRWKTLPDEERKKYEDLADQDSIRYKNDMDCFNEAKRKRREKRNKECLEELKMPISSSSPFEIKPFVPVPSKTESSGKASALSNSYTGSFRDFQRYTNKDGADNNNTDTFPIPPGTEVSLPDASGRERKYTVQYKFYRMSRAAAEDYIEKLNQMQQPRGILARCETNRQPFTHFWG
jgi:hypothetical protein